jgi:tRNA G18 (ribose-2'-O)-methylase SpoU
MKTAMGTDSLVPWRRVDRAPSVCEELKSEGYRIIALETEARAISLYELEFDSVPTAFVLGNERFGLDSDTLNSVDSICRIPVRGLKNSMNVGVAFGIAAFEWLRQYEGVRS